MAPPPPKRQKRRTIVLSDGDEDIEPLGKDRACAPVPNRVNSRDHVAFFRSGTITTRDLPTRSRTKPNKSPKSHSAASPILASPSSSSEDPPHKPRREEKGSLHAYFNAAIVSQQSKKEIQPKPSSPALDGKEEDSIEDDSLDEELQHVSSIQNAKAPTIDTRRGPTLPSTDRTGSAGLNKPAGGSQRFLRVTRATEKDSVRLAASKDREVDLQPWAEKYAPVHLEELMVHKKKVASIRSWLERVFSGRERKRLLILKGPSGAGKTATISTLAKAMDFEVTEWRNPNNSDYSSEGYISVSTQFEDFLERSGKFNSLMLTGGGTSADLLPSSLLSTSTKNKVILVEEFPNISTSASATLQSFRSSIFQYLTAQSLSSSPTPIILIITETNQSVTTAASDSFTAHRLLGPGILAHPGTTNIEFNPIATTLLTKALDIVIQKEARQSGRRRVPGPPVLKKLGEVGDVRNAISSLEFLCLRADDGDDWGGRVALKGKKGVSILTKMERQALEMVTQREASLGIFHAVGKVVYNKRDESTVVHSTNQISEHMQKYSRPMVSQVLVQDLLNETGTDISTFIAALHENYILSCESSFFADAFNDCIDALSDSDLLSPDKGFSFSGGGRGLDVLRQDEFAFHVAVRGLIFALPYPVKRHATSGSPSGKSVPRSDAFKMFWPMSMRIGRKKEEVEALIDAWYARRGTEAALKEAAETMVQHHHEPFRANIYSTKLELILERLPYLAKISPSSRSELEKITKFNGIGEGLDDTSNDNGETAVKAQSVPGKRHNARSKEAKGSTSATETRVGKLWLSDDDIEDD